MARRHEPSIAHEYDERTDACKHCHMHRANVEQLAHACTQQREAESDAREAEGAGLSVEDYRKGSDYEARG